jgi:hypothetical protein
MTRTQVFSAILITAATTLAALPSSAEPLPGQDDVERVLGDNASEFSRMINRTLAYAESVHADDGLMVIAQKTKAWLNDTVNPGGILDYVLCLTFMGGAMDFHVNYINVVQGKADMLLPGVGFVGIQPRQGTYHLVVGGSSLLSCPLPLPIQYKVMLDLLG